MIDLSYGDSKHIEYYTNTWLKQFTNPENTLARASAGILFCQTETTPQR